MATWRNEQQILRIGFKERPAMDTPLVGPGDLQTEVRYIAHVEANTYRVNGRERTLPIASPYEPVFGEEYEK